MIKEALDLFLKLSQPEFFTFDGRNFSSKPIHEIREPEPKGFTISTLTGLVNYILSNIDGLDLQKLILHVLDQETVVLRSNLFGPFKQRSVFLECKADLPEIRFGNWTAPDEFIPWLASCFHPTEDRDKIIRIVGNLRTEATIQTEDDGISQKTTAKTGVARVEPVTLPSPVTLKPISTFYEIPQPERKFVFRLKEGNLCRLIEADGKAWTNAARISVAQYLAQALTDTDDNTQTVKLAIIA